MANYVLQARHLRKQFDGQPVLKDVSLEVGKGEVVVIVGPSGCGKSTLLRCLNGLETIDGGEVLLNGEAIHEKKKDLHLIRQKIGMVFQSYDLFPHMDVLDNLLLGPTKVLRRKKAEVIPEAEALLARVGLQDKIHALPRQLSGGQKQRVALVRAMLMHPEILLLDEITAALDPEMVHEVRFAEAVADRVVFLEGGLVVEESAPGEFFHHPKTERARQFLQSFSYEAKNLQENA